MTCQRPSRSSTASTDSSHTRLKVGRGSARGMARRTRGRGCWNSSRTGVDWTLSPTRERLASRAPPCDSPCCRGPRMLRAKLASRIEPPWRLLKDSRQSHAEGRQMVFLYVRPLRYPRMYIPGPVHSRPHWRLAAHAPSRSSPSAARARYWPGGHRRPNWHGAHPGLCSPGRGERLLRPSGLENRALAPGSGGPSSGRL